MHKVEILQPFPCLPFHLANEWSYNRKIKNEQNRCTDVDKIVGSP